LIVQSKLQEVREDELTKLWLPNEFECL